MIVPFEIVNLDPDAFGWDSGAMQIELTVTGRPRLNPNLAERGTDFASTTTYTKSIFPSSFTGDVYRGQFTIPTLDDDDFGLTETLQVRLVANTGAMKGSRIDPTLLLNELNDHRQTNESDSKNRN
ncbi:MAG: hypothetical protein R3C05_08585 [Pirellulaceae bacterium]